MPCAEPVQHFHALGLVQIAVDGSRVIAVFLQRFRADIHIRLAVAEDDRVGAFFAFAVDQRTQQLALLRLAARSRREALNMHSSCVIVSEVVA